MKAIVCTKYGPPEVLHLAERDKPAPATNEVCIRVRATAVTASDCIVRAFKVPLKFRLPMGLAIGFTGPRQPILGMVFAGEVESVGKDVTLFREGDQVFGLDRFGFGTYAEYKCISEKAILATKPTNLNYEEAAAVPYGGLIALSYLAKGNVQHRQKVAVYGASGAVGTSAVQLAKYYGAEVAGICSTTNLDLVKSLGADTVIDYTHEDLTSRGPLYDLIFDAVGKRKSSNMQFKKALAPNGVSISVDDGSPKLSVANLVLLRELVETFKLRPVIDKRYRLEEMVEAHRYVDKGHKKGNVIVTIE